MGPGEDTAETCEWNASCASEVEAYEHQRLWLLVKQLFQRQQELPVPNVDGRVGTIAPLSASTTGDHRPPAIDSAPPVADARNRSPVELERSEDASEVKEDSFEQTAVPKAKKPQQAVTMADLRSSNNQKRRTSSSSSSSGSDSPTYDDTTRTPMPGKVQLGSLTPSLQDSHLSDSTAFRFGALANGKTTAGGSMRSPLALALAKLPNTGSDGDEETQSQSAVSRVRPSGPIARPSLHHTKEEFTKSETASTIKISPSINAAFSRRPSDMTTLPMAAMAVPLTAEEKRKEERRLRVFQSWRVFHINILRKAYTTTLEQVRSCRPAD
jgi:hypothetical protein